MIRRVSLGLAFVFLLFLLVTKPAESDKVVVAEAPVSRLSDAVERRVFLRATRSKTTVPPTTTTVVVTTTTTRVVEQETTLPPKPKTYEQPVTTVATTPPTTVVVAPPPSGGEYDPACLNHAMLRQEAWNCWIHLLEKYPWNAAKAFDVLYCESTGKSNAVSQSGRHWGLMQLDTGPYWDPAVNIDKAYYNYYISRGWSPWECA